VLRDGGAAGSIIMKQRLIAGGSSDQYIEDAGIRYETNLHVTMNAGVSVAGTFFVG
jgi:cyanophycinase-like exopeptidase